MGSIRIDDPRLDSTTLASELHWQTTNDSGYSILEQPYGTHAPKRLIGIGAGATGICLAKFAEEVPNLSVQIYEKNPDISGTWWENKYPGCACDIPAHIYQFLWALNPNWSHYYVGAKEIFEYFKGVVDKHELKKYFKLEHQVVGARWIEEEAKWEVEVETGDGVRFTDRCDFLVNGSGLLNNWKWPDINGLRSFKGTLIHSAAWDTSVELKGKRVAVFGAGSSGVQIVATIQSTVSHLYTWVRSPMWISNGFASRFAGPGGSNLQYSEELKQKWTADPVAHLRYVKMLDNELGKRFNFNMINTPEAKLAIDFSRKQMEEKLKTRPDLIKKMIPTNFGIGCRRPTPGSGYLEALVSPNVTTYVSEIREITPTGFIDNDGQHQEVDVIICATGFDNSFKPRFPVIGNDGRDLRDIWVKDPVSYFSVMVPSFPNYFVSLGPYSASNGSLMPSIEHGCRYILEIVSKVQRERIRHVSPKADATTEFREHADLLLKRTVWNQPCRSWFKNGTVDGLPRLYPGSRAHFVEVMQPRYEDFDIAYECTKNRYWFMGNGFALRELDGRDTTWYLGIVDGMDKEPDYTEDEAMVKSLSKVE